MSKRNIIISLGGVVDYLNENNIKQVLKEVILANDVDSDIILDYMYYSSTVYQLILLQAIDVINTKRDATVFNTPSVVKIDNESTLIDLVNGVAGWIKEELDVFTDADEYELIHSWTLSAIIKLK